MALYEPTEQDSGAIIGVSLSSGLIDDRPWSMHGWINKSASRHVPFTHGQNYERRFARLPGTAPVLAVRTAIVTSSVFIIFQKMCPSASTRMKAEPIRARLPGTMVRISK